MPQKSAKRSAPTFRMPPRRTPKPPTPQAMKPLVRNGKPVLHPNGQPVMVDAPELQEHDPCVKCGKPGSTCGDCGVVLCYECNVNPHVEQGHQPKAHLEPMDPALLLPKRSIMTDTTKTPQQNPPPQQPSQQPGQQPSQTPPSQPSTTNPKG